MLSSIEQERYTKNGKIVEYRRTRWITKKILSYELAWSGGEAVNCKIYHCKEEKNQDGTPTGRFRRHKMGRKNLRQQMDNKK